MTFSTLGLSAELLRAVADQGYTDPTPIQARAIPAVVAGHDLMASAQTGTGKTAAFTLPLLQRLAGAPATGRPRVLVLVPTRELAAQVAEAVRAYGRYLRLRCVQVYGGVNINPQISGLRAGADILVATPGRLIDHLERGTADLSGIEVLVLDEADRMLDMGFLPAIERVVKRLPRARQTLLFSATFSDPIRALARRFMRDPQTVDVAQRNAAAAAVSHRAYQVPQAAKRELLTYLFDARNWQQVLVFTRTKHGAERLAKQLLKAGIESAAIHGDKSQGQRTRALESFKRMQVRALVATDVAARGLDIEELPRVVNFDLPNVAEDYVHRIGRTGRAGQSGEAVSLVAPEERAQLRAIEKLIRIDIPATAAEGFQAPGPTEGRAGRPAPAAPARERGQRPERERRPEQRATRAGGRRDGGKHRNERPRAMRERALIG